MVVSPLYTGRLKKFDIISIFNDILTREDDIAVAFETNRGCPYHCAFCDWGGVSRSKITKLNAALLNTKSSLNDYIPVLIFMIKNTLKYENRSIANQ